MLYKEELIKIGKAMKEKSIYFHKKLYRAPKGFISITTEGHYVKIYQCIFEGGALQRIGIKRNRAMIQSLVKKAYYTEEVRRLDRNIEILRDAIKKMEDTSEESIMKVMPANINLLEEEYLKDWVPKRMHPVFDDAIKPLPFLLFVPEEERDAWGEKPYRANSFGLNNVANRTEEGFAMRSKSEVAIFDCYKRLNIPTHYDEVMNFNGAIKSPDFVSVRYDGKVIYHEHCGRVNDTQYMVAHKEKMALYEICGIVPWDNLLVTYESPNGGINLGLIEAQIRALHKK